MSQNYSLVRLKEPLGGKRVQLADLLEDGLIPFGSAADIERRLLAAPGFEPLPPESAEALERLRAAYPQMAALLPPSRSIRQMGASRIQDVHLLGDPVTSITVERSAPWDLLPAADALVELGPFALLEGSIAHLLDPEDFRPRPPMPAPPLFSQPQPPGTRPAAGMLAPLWEAAGDLPINEPPLLLAEPGILVLTAGGFMTALEARSGRTLWTRSFHGRPLRAARGAGALVLCGAHSSTFALEPADGSTLWEHRHGGEARCPPIALDDGTAALLVEKPESLRLVVLHPERGDCAWESVLDTSEERRGAILRLRASGRQVVACAGPVIYCLDASSGTMLGRSSFEPHPSGSNIVIACLEDLALARGRAFCLLPWALEALSLPRLDSASSLLAFERHAGIEPFAAALEPGLVLVSLPVAAELARLMAFDAASLRERWRLEVEASPAPPVRLDEGRAAVLLRPLRERPEEEASILIIDLLSGRVLHREPLGCRGWYGGYLAAGGGLLVAMLGPGGESRSGSGVRAFAVGPRR
jgi:hypothetical protein